MIDEGRDATPKRIIGIGASAGGLQALEALFDVLDAHTGMAFVVIQHLSPDFDSLMDQLLARHSAMSVALITDGMKVLPDQIYLLPPGKEAIYSNQKLLLTERASMAKVAFPIDEFFRSLAQSAGDDAVGVILSGTGTDGSRGVQDIHAAGGTVIVQKPETAAFDGMPQSASDTGVVDLTLAPKEIARALLRMSQNTPLTVEQIAEKRIEPIDHMAPAMRRLFVLLHRRFGLDFSDYRSETIARRIERRVKLAECESVAEFAELAARNTEELNRLYYDMLIGVTNFFRDNEVFDRLENGVLPSLIDRLEDGDEFRCWVPAVATGQEAYSLAMLLFREFDRRGRVPRIRIFASDVHEPSLVVAGRGVYCEEDLAGVPDEFRSEFFIERHDGYHVAPEVRKMVVFTSHNILKDAPFTRLHFVSCRNLLIYLTQHAQQRILSLFHFALKAEGCLCLGISESIGELRGEFRAIDESLRIFMKHRQMTTAGLVTQPVATRWTPPAEPVGKVRGRAFQQRLMSTYDSLLEQSVSQAVLISGDREILHVFGGAGRFLSFANGRPENDLFEVIHPELRSPLALAVSQLRRTGDAVAVDGVACTVSGKEETIRLEVRNAVDAEVDGASGELPDVLVRIDGSTSTVTKPAAVKLTVSEFKTVENLERELQFSQDSLQSTIEELQSLNEEAQSTNEQLTASNEELQSTNEELHSVNEELYTVNAEHQRKIDELTELNDDIDNLLSSTNVHTLFLDSKLRLRRFTPQISDIFNLIPQDIGRPIHSFTHQLQEPELARRIREVIQDGASLQREVKDKAGRWYLMRIFPYLSRGTVEGAVVTFVDVTSLQDATQALKTSEQRFERAVRGSNAGIWDWEDVEQDSMWWSERIFKMLGLERSEPMVMSVWKRLVHPQDRERVFRALDDHLHADVAFDVECRMEVTKQKAYRWFHIRGATERLDQGRVLRMAGSIEDVDDRHKAEEEVLRGVERRDQFLAMLSHELRNPLGAVQSATALISKDGADESTRGKAFDVVKRQVAQMARLLDDLLDVSRITHGKIELRRQTVDVRQVVEDALKVVQGPMEEHALHLSTEFAAEPLCVDGDAARLEQVTVNLLVNAIKYTPDGGDTRVALHREGNSIVLQVGDSGVGISEDKQSEIFSLFYQSDETLDRSSGGMGVGLTLVKAVVELHGGSIDCFSEGVGKGSLFSVRLPAVASKPRETDATPEATPTELNTIVLVEDIQDAREMFATLLSLRGYEVHQAADGEEGLALIERIRPDAAIIDIGLPKLSGHEVARRLRSQPNLDKIRLVALTGYGQDSDRKEVRESGFDLHLVKPLDPTRLDQMLNKLGRRTAASAAPVESQ